MKETKEIWKDIPNYEGYYQISNLGRVKSLERKIKVKKGFRNIKEKIRVLCNDNDGYLHCGLNLNRKVKTFKVHKLVAIVFLNHTPCGMEIIVDHINNIKTDNRVDNLQLISHRENSSKDKKSGSSKYTGVTWDKLQKKWMVRIYLNGKNKNLGRFKNEYQAHLTYQKELLNITKRNES